MQTRNWLAAVVMAGALASPSTFAQMVISAKAGVVHYTEGEVKVGNELVESKIGGRYTELKDGQELTTTEGRAEVLLNPGVFLRVGENSAIKMISNRLADTRVELLSGSALVEVAEVMKDNAVTLLVNDAAISLTKMGLVRLETATGIRVYKGEAQVLIAGGAMQTLKEGGEFLFDGNVVAKFDVKESDPLFRWSNRRAEYIAMANVASANMVQKNGNSYSSSGWVYNPYYGMMTYLPFGNGLFRSPFGYTYYTPSRVIGYYRSYAPIQSYGGGGGSSYPGRTSGASYNSSNGYYQSDSRASMGSVPASMPSASAASSAPVSSSGRGSMGGVSSGGGSGRGK